MASKKKEQALRGRIAIVGAGPAGMAAALAAIRVGFDVTLFERAGEIKAAGNILNLWPPPQKVLKLIGVDTADLGAPCTTFFENARGKRRADVKLPAEVQAEYGGGFMACCAGASISACSTPCRRAY